MPALIARKNNKRKRVALTASKVIGVGAAAAGVALVASRGARAFLSGRSRAAAAAAKSPAGREYDDVTLARKVESEIFRSEDAPKADVVVNAENGVVFLRGQVKDPEQMKQLEAAALQVDGVMAVDNLLHTPGADALTKTEGKTRSLTGR